MSKFILVFAAGGLGCVSRYALSLVWPRPATGFPWATLGANLAACLLIALAAYVLRDRLGANGVLGLVGFCGGLSTFSAFSLETVDLVNRGLWLTAAVYVFMSLAACFLTVWLLSKS